jgi:hypothetical protein
MIWHAINFVWTLFNIGFLIFDMVLGIFIASAIITVLKKN